MRLLIVIAALTLFLAESVSVGQNADCDTSIQTQSARISDEDMERLGWTGSRDETRRNIAEQMARTVPPTLRNANVQPVSWEVMATILLDFESIKPGETTRAEVDAKLRAISGFGMPSAVTMRHPLCEFCQMDIDYSYRRNPADQCSSMVAADDVVVRTSVPYLAWPFRR
jgi:hypothetical protein